MDALLRDLRFVRRALARERGFTLGAGLALALGVGAATTLFSVVWTTLVQPLPYRHPERLVTVLHGTNGSAPVSPADFRDFADRARSFDGLGAAQAWGANLGTDGGTERVRAMEVSPDLFGILGVAAAEGRTFAADEGSSGHDRVVVLSHALWTRRFARSRAIIGRRIRLNGEGYTVVGVMPASFRFAPFWQTRPELWVPLNLDRRRDDRGGRSLRLFGRLRDGVSVPQAQAEISLISDRLGRTYPDTDRDLVTTVTPLAARASAGVRPVVLATFGLALLVLCIACANVATLSLSRAFGRRSELAVRAALGATRTRLTRLLLLEGIAFGLTAAAGGLALAWAGTSALATGLPAESLPPHARVALSLPVAAFAVVAALACATVTTLLGTWQAGRTTLAAAARDGVRGATAAGSARARAVLVAIEVALTFALVTAAGLLTHALVNLSHVDPGFRPEGAVAVSVSLDGTTAADGAARARFIEETLQRARALPGVSAAGAINHLPLAGDLWTLAYWVDGRPRPKPADEPGAAYRIATPGYFVAMGERLVEGRGFLETDRAGSLPVVIVNHALARRQWPGRSALGERIVVPGPDGVTDPLTIIGVVADPRQGGLTEAPIDEVYLPLAQRASASDRAGMTLVARTEAGEGDAIAGLREAVWAGDRSAAVYEGVTIAEVLDHELWQQRLATGLANAFGLVALVLAAIGIHGVVAYAASRRTREFGIRVALGAEQADVQRLALGEALLPVGTGLALGVPLALQLPRLIGQQLFGVSAYDPSALGIPAVILLGASTWAAWRPARRAGRLDPALVLRDE